MGDIGPERQHFDVLPVRKPAEPVRREPAVEVEPRDTPRPADRLSRRG